MTGIDNFSQKSIERFAKNGYSKSSNNVLIREDLKFTNSFTWIYLLDTICHEFYTPYICEILFKLNTIYGLVNHYDFDSTINFDLSYKNLYYKISFANLVIQFKIETTLNDMDDPDDRTITEIKLIEPLTIIDIDKEIELKIYLFELCDKIDSMIDINAPTIISKKLLSSLIFVD